MTLGTQRGKDVKERLEERLRELRQEFDNGQKKLVEIEAQANLLRETLLRIGGAIQVLEEELGRVSGDAEPNAASDGES